MIPVLWRGSRGGFRSRGFQRAGLGFILVCAFGLGSAPSFANEDGKDESEALPNADPTGHEVPKPAAEGLRFPIKVDEILSHPEMHKWEKYVRGFRRDHNFAFSSGVSSGTWNVRWSDETESRNFKDSGIFSRFQFSFHLPIYEGFGYVLGSGAGYHFESSDQRSDFRPVSAWQYPSLLVGLTLNINPSLRLSLAGEAYLERHNGLEERAKNGGPPSKIYVTMQAYDGGFYLDHFYDLNWAIRVEAHRRHLEYLAPQGASGFAVDVRLHKEDRWLGLGLVYHLL